MSTRPPAFLASFLRPSRIHRGDELLQSGRGEGLGSSKGTPAHDEHEVSMLGMNVFLASLVMIFGTTLAAYAIFRWKQGALWEGGEPLRNLVSLGLATAVLVTCDLLVTRARRQAAEPAVARRLTAIALGLGSVYLVVQVTAWVAIVLDSQPTLEGARLPMEATLFLVLTFTHAAHVLGGVIANGVVLYRSRGGRGPRRVTLELLFRYWRFLTIVWFVLAAVLVAT